MLRVPTPIQTKALLDQAQRLAKRKGSGLIRGKTARRLHAGLILRGALEQGMPEADARRLAEASLDQNVTFTVRFDHA